MGRSVSKLTKRIMALALSAAMILSNMTVYAGELAGTAPQTEESVEDTVSGETQLSETTEETVQDEVTQDETVQGGTATDGAAAEDVGGTEEGGALPGTEETDENVSDTEDGATSETNTEEEITDGVQAEEELDTQETETSDKAESGEAEPETDAAGAHTLWLVGDSTVCAFDDDYYYPRYGYGTQIENYLDGTYTVQNLAMSGRSSKSFLAEGNYTTLKNGLKEGDVLVIGFGHNDEKTGEEKYTDPNGDWQTEGSFAKSLYDNYVKIAQDVKAEVILCTPIVRRGTGDTLSESECHITKDAVAGGVTYKGGDYPEAIRELGKDKDVPVVDLTELTKNLYNEIGPDETLYLHAWLSGLGGENDPGNPKSVDNTHLNIYGAKKVAYLFARNISEAADNSLLGKLAFAKHIDLSEGEPAKENTLVKNPDYVKPYYTPPTTVSSKFPSYTLGEGVDAITFNASVFGITGGASKINTENFVFGKDAEGNMNIKALKNGGGKITDAADGFAMYYYQLPANKKFKLSATAKLNSIGSGTQVAFGLMARDDMYIDTQDNALSSDYVAAGSLGDTGCNSFYRRGGELGGRTAFANGTTIAAGSEYDLSIVYNGDGYECTFGNEPAQSGGYDFQLISVDSDYVYIGMFVSREADVTFSNIKLELEGDEETAGQYTITVESDENGTAKANRDTANEGDSITLTATPNAGYAFKEWQVLSGEGLVSDIVIDYNRFTMPAGNVSIKALFEEEAASSKTIDVWDFGGKEETDSKYTNNITPEIWIAADIISSEAGTKGKFKGDKTQVYNYSFGDLTMYYMGEDRLYSDLSKLTNIVVAASGNGSNNQFEDGYKAAGAWYSNGTGSNGSRYVTIENVKAGDKIVAYMGSHTNGPLTYHFESEDGLQNDTVTTATAGREFHKYEFTAKYSGTYKIWPENINGAKPMYHRIMRIPGVVVNGQIDFGENKLPDGYSVQFVNQTTKAETDVVIKEDGSFKVALAPGYTYKAVLSGVMGFGFTSDSSNITVTDEEVFTGKDNVKLVVEPKSTFLFAGKIKGFDKQYITEKLAITMEPSEDSGAMAVALDIDSNENGLTFSAYLEPDIEYAIDMQGANDYEIRSPLVICKEDEGTSFDNRTIIVQLKNTYDVTGGFIGLSGTVEVKSLTFTNIADDYVYAATVADGGYSVKLRDGEYIAKAEVNGYATNTHVVVDGGSISKDLLFVSNEKKENIERKSDIYVGYPDKPDNYKTVKEAVEACELMNPQSEAERIKVHIAPGTYREQIIITTPYISFVNDTKDEVLLTWYYGIGYQYYSVDSSGYYNVENAYDKFDKHLAAKWGVAVYVKNTAKAFRAEGITFENSFNRYITDEEIEDGVELVSSATEISFIRKYNADVQSKAATERASAIAIEADQAEFKNCGFYSSQDTLYTGSGIHLYFKNCRIEGMTDYIFGDGDCVFDACELRWKGYSSDAVGGYITANRPDAKLGAEYGYLFRNCSVTYNHKLTATAGYFGRPWGQAARVTFINTKLEEADMIEGAGWTKMGDATPEKANFHEYNTTTVDGTVVDTASRVSGTVMDAAAINVSDYFAGWEPVYYDKEAGSIEVTDIKVSDNGDINLLKPGHTLTVSYSLGDNAGNDASVIKWYMIDNKDSDEEGTLVKSSTAIVDKTYKVGEDAVGKYIKVVVTPQTISGVVGQPQSYVVEPVVAEGYEEPSDGSDIVRGEGINIFLAGDSTVKDYSANGMYYTNGKGENLGSWGEFIQLFFDEADVKVQNYANGGRSSRTFCEEGSLSKIADNIGEGDYLFIQFGHNDCADSDTSRYVPLGTPDASGKYPVTAKTDDTEGTYKWYLKQYVEAAREKNATPILVTPVSRMYYDSDGKIYAHHCIKADEKGSSNTYVDAVKQLAEEEDVILIDAFEFTKDLFEDAWAADGKNDDTYGSQLMSSGEKTHNNKLGGLIEAIAMASAIQKLQCNLAYEVKAPNRASGTTIDNDTVFSIDSSSVITAYDINSGYTNRAIYWEQIGQSMINAVKAKAEELDTQGAEGTLNAPKATPSSGIVNKGDKVKLTVEGAEANTYEIIYTTDGSNPKTEGNENAQKYQDGGIEITSDVTIKAYTKANEDTELADSKVATYVYAVASSVKAPTANLPTGSVLDAGTSVMLTTETADAKIRYTMGTNPADPTIYSTLYKEDTGIVVTNATTIKAIAVKDGEKSAVATFVYTVATDSFTGTIKAPVFNNTDEEIDVNTIITISAEDGASIYYTMGTNPADPTIRNADLYDEDGITVKKSVIIKAIAVKGNMVSDISSHTYKVPTVAAPVASPEAGKVEKGTKVTLSSDEGASIYYTLDGSDPRISKSRETFITAITINENTTIKAYAVKDGLADSDVVTYIYTVDGSGGTNIDNSGLVIVQKNEEHTYTYTGSKITPSFEVYYNGKLITEGKDYTYKYINNINVHKGNANDKKSPKIVVKGKGNFSGSKEDIFTIEAASLKDSYDQGKDESPLLITGAIGISGYDEATDKLGIDTSQLQSNGYDAVICVAEKSKLSFTGFFNGVKINKKDYKLSKTDKWTASGDLTVTGQNNFSDKAEDALKIYVKVIKKSAMIKITKVTLKETSFNYNGEDTKADQAITSVESKNGKVSENNYNVRYCGDTINVGTVKVIVTGTGMYTGTITKTYKIKPALNNAALLKVTLGGEAVTKSVKLDYFSTGVTLENDARGLKVTYNDIPLELGMDYKIAYRGNKKVGTAKYTVTGLGNYKGIKKTGEFTINKGDLNSDNIEVVVPDVLFTKANKVYKAKPYVFETLSDGSKVLLKTSNYKVTYWDDEKASKNITKAQNADKIAYVKLEGKGAYEGTNRVAAYGLKKDGIDLSKAKVDFYESATSATKNKLSYTGSEAIPYKAVITIKKKTVTVILDEDDSKYNEEANQELLKQLRFDFTNNVNKGKASAVITSTGENSSYSGAKTATFKIIAKSMK